MVCGVSSIFIFSVFKKDPLSPFLSLLGGGDGCVFSVGGRPVNPCDRGRCGGGVLGLFVLFPLSLSSLSPLSPLSLPLSPLSLPSLSTLSSLPSFFLFSLTLSPPSLSLSPLSLQSVHNARHKKVFWPYHDKSVFVTNCSSNFFKNILLK